MLKVTTEVPVPTSPHKVKKAENNFQDRSFKKIEDLLPWGFFKKFQAVYNTSNLHCNAPRTSWGIFWQTPERLKRVGESSHPKQISRYDQKMVIIIININRQIRFRQLQRA